MLGLLMSDVIYKIYRIALCGEVENPKSEARNSKQWSMILIQMAITKVPAEFLF